MYSLGLTARLFAHDVATGKKLWEFNAHPVRPAEKKVREDALSGLAAGRFSYQLTPNWCASLTVAGGILVAPLPPEGLIGVDLASGAKKWLIFGVNAR